MQIEDISLAYCLPFTLFMLVYWLWNFKTLGESCCGWGGQFALGPCLSAVVVLLWLGSGPPALRPSFQGNLKFRTGGLSHPSLSGEPKVSTSQGWTAPLGLGLGQDQLFCELSRARCGLQRALHLGLGPEDQYEVIPAVRNSPKTIDTSFVMSLSVDHGFCP